jgi:hypothetical protein
LVTGETFGFHLRLAVGCDDDFNNLVHATPPT